MQTFSVTDEHVRSFAADGYLLVRGLFDADEMRLRQPLFQQRTAEAIASAVEAHLEATR